MEIKSKKLNKFLEKNNNRIKNLEFDKEKHCYKLDSIFLPSVSKILQDACISTDYLKVDSKILEKAKRRGIAIHLQVQEALQEDIYTECEQEATEIIEYIKSQAKEDCILTEQKIVCVKSPKSYAGRFDILIENKEDELVLYDLKTYKSWSSQKSWQTAWQLSLYAEAIEETGVKVDRIIVLKFNGDKLEPLELKRIEKDKINELLKKGSLSTILYPLDKKDVEKFISIITKEEELKILEEQVKEVKKAIFEFMQEHNILKAESLDGSLKLTAIPNTTSETIDVKRIRQEEPEIFEKYKKVSNRSGYIKISLNNNKE